MTPEQIKARLRNTARRHILDALDERGLVRGMRLEFPRPGACELKSFEEASASGGEVLIESLFTAISPGTERAIYLKLENVNEPYPHAPGYSQVGRVLRAGYGASVQEGQIVSSRGSHGSVFLSPSSRVLPVPDGVLPEHAALTQLAFISMQGVRKAAIVPGERVLVLGAGIIGQLAAQLAQIAGGEVTLAARSPQRLEVARACGIETVTTKPSEGQAEVIIDATGHPDAINGALKAAAPGARLILLGSSRGMSQNVDLALWQERAVTTIGAHTNTVPQGDNAPRAWTWARECSTFLELLAQKRLNVAPLITRFASPDEAAQVYADLARPDDKSVTVLFDWTKPGPWNIVVETVSPVRLARKALARATGQSKALAPALLPRPANGKLLRFGLIGCGEIAVENAQAIRATQNATITWAADLNLDLARGLAAATQARVTNDIAQMLAADDVDAVLICTPHHLHAPFAIQAAKAGKHVVVEKPMATNVADCDAMIKAARENGVQISVCYCQRFDPRVQRAAKLIREGALGEILGTQIMFGQYRGPDYWQGGLTGRTASDWRTRYETAGGGVLIMNSCHILDFMGFLVGSEVKEVAACGATLVQPTEVEDTISLSYRYASGAIGSMQATTTLSGPFLYEQRLWGRDGQMIVAPELKFWSKRTVSGYEAGQWHTIKRLAKAAERRQFFEKFAAAIQEDKPLPITGEEARSVQATIEAAYAAINPDRFNNEALAPSAATTSAATTSVATT